MSANDSTSQRRRTKQLMSTAYHEAGHAVSALVSEVAFTSLTIVPEGDSLGHILYTQSNRRIIRALEAGSVSPHVRDRIERGIICSLAGGVADLLVWTPGEDSEATE